MKKIILAVAILALVFPAAERAEARVDVSIDLFYNNLNTGGSWIEAGDYGYCWQPSVAVSNPRWRPYSDGYWAYTDVGWTWVSYEDFGWATYHYGRWARLRDQGWVWVPGREWAPAWVSWRTGGDYVGWAPLPPRYGGGRGQEIVYEGRSIGNTVDIDFDIGPAYYNFVDVRYIGDPVLRERIFAPTQNITYINRTVNVTNITYNNSTVYNYGPDYNRLSAYSTRPIRRLTLERPANVDYTVAAQSGGLTKVQGDKLIVAAPPMIQQPAQQQQVAPPKVVKTRIAKPEVETGWMGISDPKAKAELQEKIKKEDPKSVPPPQVQPTNAALLTASPAATKTASPAPGRSPAAAASQSPVAVEASPSPASSPRDRGRNKGKRGAAEGSPRPDAAPAEGAMQPNATATPATSPDDLKGRERGRKGRRAHDQQLARPTATPASIGATPFATAAPTASPNENRRGRGNNKRAGKDQQQSQPSDVQAGSAIPQASAAAVQSSDDRKGKERRENRPAATIAPVTPAPRDEVDRGLSRGAERPENAAPKTADETGRNGERANASRLNRDAVARTPAQGAFQQPSKKVDREVRQTPQQGMAPRNAPARAQQENDKPGKGKKARKGESSPSPTPTP